MDNTLEDFKKEVLDNKSTFKQTAPFAVAKSAELENSGAVQAINQFKLDCIELRQKEEEMKPGLDIFNIDSIMYPELHLVEKENQLLSDIWDLKEQFDNEWQIWK